MAPATLGATRIDGGRSLYDSLGLCLKDEFQPRICEPAVFGPQKDETEILYSKGGKLTGKLYNVRPPFDRFR